MSVERTLSSYILGLQHVGHIVDDIEVAVATFCSLYGVGEDSVRRVPGKPDGDTDTLFAFVSVGDTEFELIQPLSTEFREKLHSTPSGGGGINHVAWRVSDIAACVDLLNEQGITPGHVTPNGIVEFENLKLVYFDPQDTGGLLIELLEIGGK